MKTSPSRRTFIQSAASIAAVATSVLPVAHAQNQNTPINGTSTMTLTQAWDKTFPLSNKVRHEKVTFRNRYGITLVGDVYVPKEAGRKKLPALVVSGPFGAVKEQSSGLYAHSMAERGFVALAFDPSYTGESGGEPRNVASVDINTEDFSAAVDFLGLQANVDRDRMGIIGVCGWAGMALNAAAMDKRIKAVVVSAMYDMSRLLSKGYNDSVTPAQRTESLLRMSQQRWLDAEKGAPAPSKFKLPETLKGNEPEFVKGYYSYYKTPRGFHKNSVNSNSTWTATTAFSFMNFPMMGNIREISPNPVLFIAGEKAHSRYFSEDAFQAAAEPKELVVVKDAVHTDLYDRMDKIPFDKIEAFFKASLK